MRNPDPISRLADETGDSIAEHSDDESMTNAPDTPDVGNVSFNEIGRGLWSRMVRLGMGTGWKFEL